MYPRGYIVRKILIVSNIKHGMDPKLLENIGITEAETRVYLALVELGSTKQPDSNKVKCSLF